MRDPSLPNMPNPNRSDYYYTKGGGKLCIQCVQQHWRCCMNTSKSKELNTSVCRRKHTQPVKAYNPADFMNVNESSAPHSSQASDLDTTFLFCFHIFKPLRPSVCFY